MNPVIEAAPPNSAADISLLLQAHLSDFLLRPGAHSMGLVGHQLGLAASSITFLQAEQESLSIDLRRVFQGALGRFVFSEYERACALLPTYDQHKMISMYRGRGAEFFQKYFCMSMTRVYHLLEMLLGFGVVSGTVLEIGSLFGTFSGSLQRAGYQVTAIDRYKTFGGALDAYVEDMRSSGATVVETSPEEEEAATAALGKFDIVISMAVIEHIPHTPRLFLQKLKEHLKPGGLLFIDTPNIARYWNRRYLSEGKSIHQPIAMQFRSEIPFEGHHREYTINELRWMMSECGLADVRATQFDYNLLQFDILSREHIDALLTMIVDPSMADTNLVGARNTMDR
jgi:2-polyprenyl-3-methyl-5-hydroxy-6-metoxy-1,4-benzoquinol methylase